MTQSVSVWLDGAEIACYCFGFEISCSIFSTSVCDAWFDVVFVETLPDSVFAAGMLYSPSRDKLPAVEESTPFCWIRFKL